MRDGVAPRGEGTFWFVLFWVVFPALAYDRWGGWLGVILYVLFLVGLAGVTRFVVCRVKGLQFFRNVPR